MPKDDRYRHMGSIPLRARLAAVAQRFKCHREMANSQMVAISWCLMSGVEAFYS